jgi:hydroxymethylglutaryl-CoA lyase
MADAEQLCAGLRKVDGVVYSGLVLNVKGIERAADAGLTHVAASISVSDTHSRKNANSSLSEARQRFAEMVRIGKQRGLIVRGGLQCVFGCRFEGRIDPQVVADIVKEQLDQGVDEIALADSTGMANPRSIQEVCTQVREFAGDKTILLHLHDTEGKGLANALAALSIGITHFDTAFGGMGGCPFIKGASGNIATEDFVCMLSQMGIASGIDVDQVAAISRELEFFFEKAFSGKMHRLLMREDIRILRA